MEPTAKVVIQTTRGEIFIELFAKETEKFCRPFLQNCLDNKYKDIAFNKVLPNLVQTQGNGQGTKIKKSYHLRLKFTTKGCVGLVDAEDSKNATVDGFFITTKEAPELNNHFVMIGRVMGDSLYNVVKMAQNDLKEDGETPVHPIKIEDTRVTEAYFPDLKPSKREDEVAEPKKKKRKAVKLDYDEEEGDEEGQLFKMRSAHETLDDKKLVKGTDEEKQSTQKNQDEYTDNKDKKATSGDEEKESSEENAEEKPEEEEEKPKKKTEEPKKKSDKKSEEKVEEQPEEEPEEKLDPKVPKNEKSARKPSNHEIVSVELANKQAETEVSTRRHERDLDLDPPYDSDLDLDMDSIEYEQLCKHKFVC